MYIYIFIRKRYARRRLFDLKKIEQTLPKSAAFLFFQRGQNSSEFRLYPPVRGVQLMSTTFQSTAQKGALKGVQLIEVQAVQCVFYVAMSGNSSIPRPSSAFELGGHYGVSHHSCNWSFTITSWQGHAYWLIVNQCTTWQPWKRSLQSWKQTRMGIISNSCMGWLRWASGKDMTYFGVRHSKWSTTWWLGAISTPPMLPDGTSPSQVPSVKIRQFPNLDSHGYCCTNLDSLTWPLYYLNLIHWQRASRVPSSTKVSKQLQVQIGYAAKLEKFKEIIPPSDSLRFLLREVAFLN